MEVRRRWSPEIEQLKYSISKMISKHRKFFSWFVQAFVGVAEDFNSIVIAFRGTQKTRWSFFHLPSLKF